MDIYEYYFSLLKNDEQKLYIKILNKTKNHQEKLIFKEKYSKEQIEKIFRSLFYDHPELYWIKNYTIYFGKIYSSIKIGYCLSKQNVKKIDTILQNKYFTILKNIDEFKTNKDKIKFIHDVFIRYGKYNNDKTQTRTNIYQSIVSFLTTGNTVCAGFSYSFKYLMDKIGIPSITIYDETKRLTDKAHVWNAVFINNTWYYLDITWDNQFKNDKYFLLDKDSFYKTHTIQEFLPN